MEMSKLRFVVQAPLLYFMALVLIALAISAMLYYTDANADARYIGVLSGLVTGLGIAAIQFFTQYIEQNTLAEYKKHGLDEFLPNRKDAEYYRKLIKQTEVGDKIVVVGVTCNRLLDDFANPTNNQSQDLLEAMARNVDVTLLLPKVRYLVEPNLSDFNNKTLPKAQAIEAQYPSNFKIRYYDFEPSHSIFLAGSYCLVGPIFKNIPSRDTPAIKFHKDGRYIKPYLQYINETINNSSPNHV
ncbi:hypothetical protein [Pseudomonas ogarae]|uniref:hypothetical protein n=1 Tax=Pseudomonas ogarae (strain DSM 112162 / CECT 30235 / F113) TaxID=1114970 RepID=UPI00194F71EA|nr:hypothetical protein [Pseudomonas ogarae]